LGFPEISESEGCEINGVFDDGLLSFHPVNLEQDPSPLAEAQMQPVASVHMECTLQSLHRSSTPGEGALIHDEDDVEEEILYSQSFPPFDISDELDTRRLKWKMPNTSVERHVPMCAKRSCIRSAPNAVASSNESRHVVFNETMEVRYFTRSLEEVAIMKQCAADRRQQHKARRLRRQQLVRAMETEADDDDEDSLDKIDTPVVYRCGIPFQGADDDDGDDELEQSTSSGRVRTTADRNENDGQLVPDDSRRQSSMLQNMVNEITGMISDAMISVKRPPEPRRAPALAGANHVVEIESSHSPEKSSNRQSLDSHEMDHALSCSNESTANSATSGIDGNVVAADDPLDDEGPWLFSALHCGGSSRLSI
jgi:hypothetical protein